MVVIAHSKACSPCINPRSLLRSGLRHPPLANRDRFFLCTFFYGPRSLQLQCIAPISCAERLHINLLSPPLNTYSGSFSNATLKPRF
jgi:hypothetical protein